MTLWRKSSRSASTANCVEVARVGTRVAARDSKNLASTITVPAASWARFVRGPVVLQGPVVLRGPEVRRVQ